MSSRRALLRAAAAGTLGAALARVPVARAATADIRAGALEVRTLRELIAREDAARAAYALAAERTSDDLLARLAAQDAEHAAALRTVIEGLAVGAGGPAPDPAAGDPDARPLARARDLPAARAAAIALEEALLAAHARTAVALADPPVLQIATTVAAGHAQQLVALRLAAGRPALGAGRAGRA